MELKDIIGLLSRFVHIASATALLGGVIFARHVLTNASEISLLARYAKTFQIAMAGLLASGLYNLLAKASVPAGYHAVFGVKFLLALHVFAVTAMLGRPGTTAEKAKRQMTGVVISGTAILALGAWLRYLTTR
jgi:hypothetical protein